MSGTAKAFITTQGAVVFDFNGTRLLIDNGELPMNWQRCTDRVDCILVDAPKTSIINNAIAHNKENNIPVVGSILTKELRLQLKQRGTCSITCPQSEKFEPIVLFKKLNERIEMIVLDGGQKTALAALEKIVEKGDSNTIQAAASKYGLIFILVWRPGNLDGKVKRVLYTGNASMSRVVAALEKANLPIIRLPEPRSSGYVNPSRSASSRTGPLNIFTEKRMNSTTAIRPNVSITNSKTQILRSSINKPEVKKLKPVAPEPVNVSRPKLADDDEDIVVINVVTPPTVVTCEPIDSSETKIIGTTEDPIVCNVVDGLVESIVDATPASNDSLATKIIKTDEDLIAYNIVADCEKNTDQNTPIRSDSSRMKLIGTAEDLICNISDLVESTSDVTPVYNNSICTKLTDTAEDLVVCNVVAELVEKMAKLNTGFSPVCLTSLAPTPLQMPLAPVKPSLTSNRFFDLVYIPNSDRLQNWSSSEAKEFFRFVRSPHYIIPGDLETKMATQILRSWLDGKKAWKATGSPCSIVISGMTQNTQPFEEDLRKENCSIITPGEEIQELVF